MNEPADDNDRPTQNGEAVEVVGYLDAHDCLWNETTHPDRMIPLMTVAQHERIVAAATLKLIEEQRIEIAKLMQMINQLRQKQ